ncbi:MAG TPA: hypothetical protein VF204_23455 [Streptosporangiaceae bacterium]
MFRSLFPELVGPLPTTLTAAIGFVVKDWQQQRSRDRQRKEALAHSTARVTFIGAWLDAQSRVAEGQDLAEARRRAERDLEATYDALDNVLADLTLILQPDDGNGRVVMRKCPSCTGKS